LRKTQFAADATGRLEQSERHAALVDAFAAAIPDEPAPMIAAVARPKPPDAA